LVRHNAIEIYSWCWDGMHSALHLPWPTSAQHIRLILHLSNGVATRRNFWRIFPEGESPSIVWWLRVIDDKFGVEEIWPALPSCLLELYAHNSNKVIQVTMGYIKIAVKETYLNLPI
jgi:hypothetical protein